LKLARDTANFKFKQFLNMIILKYKSNHSPGAACSQSIAQPAAKIAACPRS
jgi:hypothetical protein